MAVTALAVGASAAIGLEAPTQLERIVVRQHTSRQVVSEVLPVRWLILVAVVGAVGLLLSRSVLVRETGRWRSAAAAVTAASLIVTALVPFVHGVLLACGAYLFTTVSPDNVVQAIVGGTAVTLAIGIGVLVVIERTSPAARGLTAAASLVGLAVLGLVAATVIVALGWLVGLAALPLVLTGICVAGIVQLHRGRIELAQGTLTVAWVSAVALVLLTLMPAWVMGSIEGVGYGTSVVAAFGGPVLAVGVIALTGRLAGVRPLRTPSRSNADCTAVVQSRPPGHVE